MGYDRIVYIRYHFSCGLDRKDACWLSFTPLTGCPSLFNWTYYGWTPINTRRNCKCRWSFCNAQVVVNHREPHMQMPPTQQPPGPKRLHPNLSECGSWGVASGWLKKNASFVIFSTETRVHKLGCAWLVWQEDLRRALAAFSGEVRSNRLIM